jgi:trehalose-6-phosphatase
LSSDGLGFDARSDVLPVYIGDDRTDEDAFMVRIQLAFEYVHSFFRTVN